jgi:hypothetical protein
MKWLLRSTPLFALVFAACTTTNNPVTNIYTVDSTAPTITRFTPDTVWTGGTLTIYGTHFGFGNDVSVAIDTTQVRVSSTYDTVMTVNIPETAQTGLIGVGTINGRAASAKAVVVEYTFNPSAINDSLPIGSSFSIPGTGMNHSHGLLLLTVAGIRYPIDSVFANRIVSHVPPFGLSGSIVMNDSSGTYNLGSLAVTRPSSWNTLSIIWDHVSVTETHTRFGYVNGSAHPIDSTWKDTVLYLGQHDVNVSGVPFTEQYEELYYDITVPYLQIIWDTLAQNAEVFYEPSSSSNTATLTLDTIWRSVGYNESAMLPVTNAIEFVMPNFSYTITEDSTDTQGLVNWQETTSATLVSGSFDLILKP